jgi:hypothetical protein
MRARAKLDAWLGSPRPRKLTPVQAHRLRCIDCCGGIEIEVVQCPSVRCPGWMYRTGHYTPIPEADWQSGSASVTPPECPSLRADAGKVAVCETRTAEPLTG